MLLAIDVGNTNTVLGLFDGDELVRSYRIKTDARPCPLMSESDI